MAHTDKVSLVFGQRAANGIQDLRGNCLRAHTLTRDGDFADFSAFADFFG